MARPGTVLLWLVVGFALVDCGKKSKKPRGPLPVGATCAADSDCDSRFCIDVGDHSVCSSKCKKDEHCPAGWACGKYAGDDDTKSRKFCLCEAGQEACDGVDNDCDAQVDEGSAAELGCGAGSCIDATCFCPPEFTCSQGCVDTLSDPDNCGSCGLVCAVPHAAPACVAGECAVGSCDAGFGDCYDDDGCETPLTSLTNCGGCNEPCELDGGLATCASGSCQVLSCYGDRVDCNPDDADGCESLASSAHCGACDQPCAPEHAQGGSCTTGRCEYSACDSGYVDCDGDSSNGCELEELVTGTTARTFATTDRFLPSCTDEASPERIVLYTAPSTGRHVFTIDSANGVPVVSVAHGACGGYFDELACAHDAAASAQTIAVPAFEGETLLIVVESDDPDAELDFTVSVNTDETGFCADGRDNDEDGTIDCADSDCADALRCTVGCPPDWDDCDANASNGCEQLIDTGANCGACNLRCSPPQAQGTCIETDCLLGDCWSGFDDCNGKPRDGCEQALNTSKHCGACAKACALPNANASSCETGECVVVTCNTGFADCDGNATNGCEPLNTEADCAACEEACVAIADETVSCASGQCEIAGCPDGAADVDGSRVSGCEAILIGSVLEANGTTIGAADVITASCLDAATPERIFWWIAPETASYTFAASSNVGLPVLAVGRLTGGWNERLCDRGMPAQAAMPVAKGTAVAIVIEGLVDGGDFVLQIGASEARFCADGVDNDGDNSTDCNDSDCPNTAQCEPGTDPGEPGCSAGSDDCDDDPATACNPLNTPANCVACGLECDPANGAGRCTGSTCVLTSCDAGFADCDANPWNGCERSVLTNTDCRICGEACTLANAVATSCATGECQVVECAPGFDNCDGVQANGCEADLKTLETCGACRARCLPLHVVGASCSTGSCEYADCADGYASCDQDPWSGCERPITTRSNCGECDAQCTVERGVAACVDQTCTRLSCDELWGACDSESLDCSTQLTNDGNCGECGKFCVLTGSVATCNGNMLCEIQQCYHGFDNCDGDRMNGCEPLTTADNCGDCNRTCDPPNVASSTCEPGTCVIDGNCSSGFVNCDRSPWNGCEAVDLGDDLGSWSASAALATSDVNGTCVSEGPIWLYVWRAPSTGTFAFALDNQALVLRSLQKNCGNAVLPFDCQDAATNSRTLSLYEGAAVLLVVEGASSADVGFELTIDATNPPSSCDADLNTTENCGVCNRQCLFDHATGIACSAEGNCTFSGCEPFFADHNKLPGDGCEFELNTLEHCGEENSSCALPNVRYRTCETRECKIIGDGCDDGFDNCDENDSNGCEASLANGVETCGSCENNCTATLEGTHVQENGYACVNSACAVLDGGCEPSYGNCDKDHRNGCEQSLLTNEHCKDCNSTCSFPNYISSCGTGECVPERCIDENEYRECGGSPSSGCESLSEKPNCGACTEDCSGDHVNSATCVAKQCQLSCAGYYADCNKAPEDGCETNLRPAGSGFCSTCTSMCDHNNADETCADGACEFKGCHADYGNCDGNLATNGCEREFGPEDCGSCVVTNLGSETDADDGSPVASGTTLLGANSYVDGNCSGAPLGSEAPDWTFVWSVPADGPADGKYAISTAGSEFNTTLYVGRGDCNAPTDLRCNDDAPNFADQSMVVVRAGPGQRFVIIVDGAGAGDQGDFELHIAPTTATEKVTCADPPCTPQDPPTAACGDNFDNDGDGLVDCNDYGCANNDAYCTCTTCPAESPRGGMSCNNALDDDGDHYADCADPDCRASFQCSNYQELCYDGVDNNGDQLTDCADPMCEMWLSCIPETCDSGVDDDHDSLVDCDDPDCSGKPGCSMGCPEIDLTKLSYTSVAASWHSPDGAVVYQGTLDGANGHMDGNNGLAEDNCAADGSEVTFVFRNTAVFGGGKPATWVFDTRGSAVDTVLYVLQPDDSNHACAAPTQQCDRDIVTDDTMTDLTPQDIAGRTWKNWSSTTSGNSAVAVQLSANDTTIVVVDAPHTSATGAFMLNLGVYEFGSYEDNGTKDMCDDGTDNDGDGKTDHNDSDCMETLCGNNFDDDGDGQTDCQDSDCVVNPAFAVPKDCDPKLAGCETDLGTTQNCGTCGNDCSTRQNVVGLACTAGQCAYSGCQANFLACDDNPNNGCDTNVANDSNHCGSCEKCALTNVGSQEQTCSNKVCVRTGAKCTVVGSTLFCDCNTASADRETAVNTTTNCGACGITCAHGATCDPVTPDAVTYQCNEKCSTTFPDGNKVDCDDDLTGSCETDLTSDRWNCNYCDAECGPYRVQFGRDAEPVDTFGYCIDSHCQEPCSWPYARCPNKSSSDYCNTNLAEDEANCGICGKVTPYGYDCENGEPKETCPGIAKTWCGGPGCLEIGKVATLPGELSFVADSGASYNSNLSCYAPCYYPAPGGCVVYGPETCKQKKARTTPFVNYYRNTAASFTVRLLEEKTGEYLVPKASAERAWPDEILRHLNATFILRSPIGVNYDMTVVCADGTLSGGNQSKQISGTDGTIDWANWSRPDHFYETWTSWTQQKADLKDTDSLYDLNMVTIGHRLVDIETSLTQYSIDDTPCSVKIEQVSGESCASWTLVVVPGNVPDGKDPILWKDYWP